MCKSGDVVCTENNLQDIAHELAQERGLETKAVFDVLVRVLEEHYLLENGWMVDVYWDRNTLAARRVVQEKGQLVEIPLEISPWVVSKLRPVFIEALSREVEVNRRRELKRWIRRAVLGEVMVVRNREVWVWLKAARARGILHKQFWVPQDEYKPGSRFWFYVRRLDKRNKYTLLLSRRSGSLPLALLEAWGWRGKAEARRKPGEYTLLLVRQGTVEWELRDRLARALGERVGVRWVVK